jgi:hypothetical protein
MGRGISVKIAITRVARISHYEKSPLFASEHAAEHYKHHRAPHHNIKKHLTAHLITPIPSIWTDLT